VRVPMLDEFPNFPDCNNYTGWIGGALQTKDSGL